jgi:hypothetical protein
MTSMCCPTPLLPPPSPSSIPLPPHPTPPPLQPTAWALLGAPNAYGLASDLRRVGRLCGDNALTFVVFNLLGLAPATLVPLMVPAYISSNQVEGEVAGKVSFFVGGGGGRGGHTGGYRAGWDGLAWDRGWSVQGCRPAAAPKIATQLLTGTAVIGQMWTMQQW